MKIHDQDLFFFSQKVKSRDQKPKRNLNLFNQKNENSWSKYFLLHRTMKKCNEIFYLWCLWSWVLTWIPILLAVLNGLHFFKIFLFFSTFSSSSPDVSITQTSTPSIHPSNYSHRALKKKPKFWIRFLWKTSSLLVVFVKNLKFWLCLAQTFP